jgi:hypothetical protein
VPTYPVFGTRSEEPDGIEPELQPMSPGMENEPLPAPSRREPDDYLNDEMDDDLSADEDVDDLDQTSGELKLAAPQQLVQQAGWKRAGKQPAPVAVPTRPCANRAINFRQPSSLAR